MNTLQIISLCLANFSLGYSVACVICLIVLSRKKCREEGDTE